MTAKQCLYVLLQDNRAVCDDRHFVTHPLDVLEDVAGHEHRCLFSQAADKSQHIPSPDRIEGRCRFIEQYDPSLPPVYGHHDMLVQIFLNLVKNAAEAVPEEGGEITLTTAFQHGLRVQVPGSRDRLDLPLVVTVQDNGQGVPEDIRANLFDPFVTTKPSGTGLGLSLVAKAVNDHGGVIEVDSRPRRTVFKVMLPMYNPKA